MNKKEEYQEYLKSDDWKDKRYKKISRSNFTKKRCAICASKNNLEIHHLNYKNLYDVEQNDLRILCHRCHQTTHKLFEEGKIVFRNKSPHSRFAIIKAAVKKELKLKGNMFNKYKEKIKKEGEPCRKCKTPVILKKTGLNAKVYNWCYFCPNCKKTYISYRALKTFNKNKDENR